MNVLREHGPGETVWAILSMCMLSAVASFIVFTTPARAMIRGALEVFEDGLLVVRGGRVVAIGPADELLASLHEAAKRVRAEAD